jgi:two-component system response regulator NreC
MAIRVLVVDDHNIVRRIICSLLQAESDVEIVAEATTGTDAIAKAKEYKPDVIVLDLSLPDMNGLAVARLLGEAVPLSRILILSEHDGPVVKEGFRAGALGYLLKSDSATELRIAVRKVSTNQQYLSTKFTHTPSTTSPAKPELF